MYSTDATLPDEEWTVEEVPGGQTSVTLRDLEEKAHYYIKISAKRESGESMISSTSVYETPYGTFALLAKRQLVSLLEISVHFYHLWHFCLILSLFLF